MGSSDSLSLPSEPPDIGNWFSSYVYESPELNTVDDFKDSNGSMVAETEESASESRQNLSGNIILKRNAHLLLDGKGTSDVVINCKNRNRDDNFISEVFKYSDSSLCSEPPEIKKWFSSYVYESPLLDTSYEFRSSRKENEAHEQENDAKSGSEEKETLSNSPRTGKDDFEGEKVSSDGLLGCINFLEDKENEDPYIPKDSQKANGNQNSAKLNDLMTQWRMDQTLQKKTMQNKGNGSANDFVITGSSLDKLSSAYIPEVSPVFLNMKCGSHKKRGESAEKSTLRWDLREENSKAGDLVKGIDIIVSTENHEFNQVDGKPVKKTGPSVDKHNHTEFTETGFISTRKSGSRRVDEENYFKGPTDVKSDNVENGVIISPCKSREAITRRKVLSESTNLQPSNAIEVTGKWRCPQKSKPNLGPPLKQLRLEQWVHRL